MHPADMSTGARNGSVGVGCNTCGYVATLPPAPTKNKLFVAGFGLASTAVGLALLYIDGYKAYCDALDGAASVEISLSAAIMGPVLAVLGVALLVPTPTQKPPEDGSKPGLTVFGYIFLIALVLGVVGGLVGYFWLRLFLKDRGYAF